MVLDVEPVFHKTDKFPVPPVGVVDAIPSVNPKHVMLVRLGLTLIAAGSVTRKGTKISQLLASVSSKT